MQRGQGIRRRRRAFLLIGSAALAQIMLAMPLLVANTDDDSSTVETASDTTVSTALPETLVGVSPPETTAPTTAAVAATTVVTAPAPTTASLQCRNSEDPRCGPFRWDPAPEANGAAQASMTHTPSQPRAGEPVRFTVRGTDPDAAETRVWSGPCVTPNPGGSCPTTPTTTACDPHGPWTPPPRRALNREETWTLTFPDPGTYRVTFTLQTQSHPCLEVDPYGSPASTQLDVVIRPAQ